MQRREDVGERARPHLDALVVVGDLDRAEVEVGTADLEPSEREPARRLDFAADRERQRVFVREHERRAGPEHAVHLTEQAVEVFDLGEHAGREGEVDRVGAQEREIGGVALVPLDA